MTLQASPLLDAPTALRGPTRSVSGGAKARLLFKCLPRLRCGRLSVKTPDGDVVETVGAEAGPEAKVRLRRWRALRRMAFAGDIGAAESYIDGDWTSPNLTACIALAARNREAVARELRGSVVVEWIERLRNRLHANSLRGSRRNIMSHYDLGNDFFRLWLDRSMVYSSALWDRGDLDLDAAQRRKFERIAECLRLAGGESVLEIGFGWGALAMHLAESFGASVTGLTLSPSQLAFAQGLAVDRALDAKIDLRLQDYREVEGQFDRVVSIEMFEAVGEAYWPAYFQTIRRSLRPGGVAVLQVITIAEDRYASYRSDPDFIQKYVFPGGFLPSKTALAEAVRAAGLVMTSSQAFGLSYARTLAEWRRRFHARWPEIASLGFDRRFRRLWDYYLSYCEAGFAEGAIDVGLYVIEHDSAAAPAS